MDVIWENPEENHRQVENELSQLSSCDLVLLPEMFNTGFSQNKEIAQPMNGLTINWMKAMARKYQLAIAGTLAIKEDGFYYNRFVWVFPNGEIDTYDKHILFTFGNEKKLFSEGNKKKTITYFGWKFQIQICYELRFPIWTCNNFSDKGYQYDVLIYPANWPVSRQKVWDTLLPARAIENQAYSLGINRVGKELSGLTYGGGTQCCFADGENILKLEDKAQTLNVSLDYEKLTNFRTKFPFAKDWGQQIL